MNKFPLFFVFVLTAGISCTNQTADKQKELALKEKELALKEKKLMEREVAVKASTDTITKTVTNELSNVENLIGYWFVPHAAFVNIRFYRNGKFIFKDYNATLDKNEPLQGNFQLDKGVLTLLYDDRPKQIFKFYRGDKPDDNFYFEKGSYYFVKGENGSDD